MRELTCFILCYFTKTESVHPTTVFLSYSKIYLHCAQFYSWFRLGEILDKMTILGPCGNHRPHKLLSHTFCVLITLLSSALTATYLSNHSQIIAWIKPLQLFIADQDTNNLGHPKPLQSQSIWSQFKYYFRVQKASWKCLIS